MLRLFLLQSPMLLIQTNLSLRFGACTLPDLNQFRSRSVSLSMQSWRDTRDNIFPLSGKILFDFAARWSMSRRAFRLLNSQHLLSFSFKSFGHCFWRTAFAFFCVRQFLTWSCLLTGRVERDDRRLVGRNQTPLHSFRLRLVLW